MHLLLISSVNVAITILKVMFDDGNRNGQESRGQEPHTLVPIIGQTQPKKTNTYFSLSSPFFSPFIWALSFLSVHKRIPNL